MLSDLDRYIVEFTDPAEADLEAITDYLVEQDSADVAARLLVRILDRVQSLKIFPERGSVPGELIELGIHDHRQVLLSPYRLIYHVGPAKVSIVLIADGRREIRALLRQRLLKP